MAIQDLKTSLDLKQDLNIYLKCKQFDNLNLKLNIFDNSVQANLTGYNVRLRAMKSDQVPLIQEHTGITINSNIVNIEADEQLTTTAGDTPIELQFIDSTGNKKATFNLVLKVVPSVIAVSASVSTATYTLLEELENKLDQASDFFENIDQAIELNDELTTQNTNATSNISSLNTQNANATQNISSLETQNNSASTNIPSLTSLNAQAEANIDAMESFGDVTQLAQNVQAVKTEIEKARGNEDNLNERLNRIDTTINLKSNYIYRTLNKLINKQPIKIVCYGDSITYGYKASAGGQVANPYPSILQTKLRELFQYNDITVINDGNVGWQSDEALNNLQSIVLSQTPDLCILNFGINDCKGSATGGVMIPVTDYIINMSKIIEELNENNIDIILSTPTPILLDVYKYNLKFYADAIRQLAENYNIKLIDLQRNIKKIWEYKFIAPVVLLPDDIHFADDSYKYIAYEFIRAFFDLNLSKVGLYIPSVKNPDCLTDCTSIYNLATQFFKYNYILKSINMGSGYSGTYIKLPFWVEDIKNVYLVYPTANTGTTGKVRINGIEAQTINFYSSDFVPDVETLIKNNLDYGLNILEINYADGGNAGTGGGFNLFCSAITFK